MVLEGLQIFGVTKRQPEKPYTTQSRLLITLKEKYFENIVGKGENAGS